MSDPTKNQKHDSDTPPESSPQTETQTENGWNDADKDMNEPIENEETLEGNIQALMTGASAPPAMKPAARERIFELLEARHAELREADEPSSRPVPGARAAEDDSAPPADILQEDDPGQKSIEDRPARALRAPESKTKAQTSRTGGTSSPAHLSWKGYVVLAAVGLIGLAIFLLFDGDRPLPEEDEPAEDVAQLADTSNETVTGPHDNPDAQVKVVSLTDGSRIKLATGAAIDVTGDRQVTVEKGQVAIDVVKTEDNTPFLVRSPHGQIQVLGTRFLVNVSGEETLTTVLRGTVRVQNDLGNAILHQGEEAALSESEPPTRRPAPRISHLASWTRDVDHSLDGDQPARRGNLLARDPDPRRHDQEFPLEMRNLSLDVHVEDQVARVTVDQTFFNQTQRQLEGVYSFPLPGDAAVSRLAMYVNGNLMEGGIIERDRGRDVYEGIVYRRRDPALLEWMQGNQFKVRIFPLPPRTEKRILLSYTQTLEKLYDSYKIVVPIPAVDRPVDTANARVRLVGKADVTVSSSTHTIKTAPDGDDLIVTWNDTDVDLGDDLILTVHETGDSEHAPAVTHVDGDEKLLMARLQPKLDTTQQVYTPRRWVVLYDTSASRTPALLRAQAYVLRQFINHIDEDDEISLVAFDTAVRPMEGGFQQVDSLDPTAVDQFLHEESQGLGLTDLNAALNYARSQLEGIDDDLAPHVLYLGDGVAVESDEALGELTDSLAGRATFVGVGIGDTTDMRLLDQLASATGGLAVSMNPGEDLAWKAFDTVATLNTPRVLGLEAFLVDQEGNPVDADQYASHDRLAAGEELTLVAKLGDQTPAAVELKGQLAGKPWTRTIPLSVDEDADARFLPRTWARARIETLLDDPETNAEEISALGMKHFLITPFTSLLVLENDKMYDQYDVNRGDENSWARYPAPKKIDVVSEPVNTVLYGTLDPDTIIFRSPVQILANQSGYNQYWRTPSAMPLGATGFGRGGGGLDLSGFGAVDYTEEAQMIPLVDEKQNDEAELEDGESNKNTFSFRTQPRGANVVVTDGDFRNSRLDDNDWVADDGVKLALTKVTKKTKGRRRAEHSRFQSVSAGQPIVTRGLDGYYDPYYMTNIYPQAFYSSDYRLNDLLEFVPGIFGSRLDAASNELLSLLPTRSGSITPAASKRLHAVRAALVGAQFQRGDTHLSISDTGFSLTRTTPMGLAERIDFDGTVLRHRYPELGLALKRTIGELSPALLPLYVPFLPADDAALTTWYDVTLDGNSVHLTPIDGDEDQTITLQLDDNRITAVVYPGEDNVIEMDWSGDQLALTFDGTEQKHWSRVESGAPELSDDDAYATLEMPLRAPSYWTTRLEDAEPGSEEWRHILLQQSASYSALQQPYSVAQNAHAMLDAKLTPTRGELAVFTAAVSNLNNKDLKALTKKASDAGDITRWMKASHAKTWQGRTGQFSSLAKKDGLIGTLAHYRDAAEGVESYNGKKSDAENAIAFIKKRGVPSLSWILAYHISNNWYRWRTEKLAQKAWNALLESDPPSRWKMVARSQLVRQAYNQGDYDLAALRLNTLLDDAEETGEFPAPDSTWPYIFQYGTGGATGWRSFLGRWREVALKTQSPDGLLNLVALAAQGNDIEAELVYAGLSDELRKDQAFMTRLAELLNTIGKTELALRVVNDLLPDPSDDSLEHAGLLELAADIAMTQGRHAVAADYLQRVLDVTADQPMPLATVRARYHTLVDLRRRTALIASDDVERKRAVEAMLDAAEAWREEDPANPNLDRLTAEALYALDQDDEGWRYISSIAERGPREGQAWADVASFLESQGQRDRAAELWDTAIEVEPTNPTWLMGLARNAEVQGDVDRALELATRVTDEDWQPRFSTVVQNATRMTLRLQ